MLERHAYALYTVRHFSDCKLGRWMIVLPQCSGVLILGPYSRAYSTRHTSSYHWGVPGVWLLPSRTVDRTFEQRLSKL